MDNHVFFNIALSFMVMHEMDAIRCKEWRIFPGLSLLDDDWGFKVFMLAHVPLFFFIFFGLSGQSDNEGLIFGLNIFFAIHVGLHLFFLRHKKNEFKDWISWTIILSAGLFGLLDLVI
jgi:hypothetical protein